MDEYALAVHNFSTCIHTTDPNTAFWQQPLPIHTLKKLLEFQTKRLKQFFSNGVKKKLNSAMMKYGRKMTRNMKRTK